MSVGADRTTKDPVPTLSHSTDIALGKFVPERGKNKKKREEEAFTKRLGGFRVVLDTRHAIHRPEITGPRWPVGRRGPSVCVLVYILYFFSPSKI